MDPKGQGSCYLVKERECDYEIVTGDILWKVDKHWET